MPYERAAGGYMAARKASKKVINFFVVGLTYGCRKMCAVRSCIGLFLARRFIGICSTSKDSLCFIKYVL